MLPKSQTILQVEDDANDVLFFHRAMIKAAVDAALQVVRDGRQAIEYLSGVGEYADRASYPLPTLILLDLRLPKVPGHEVIRWIRKRPEFKSLPIIVFTSSNEVSDIEKAYRSGANGYLVKPINPAELLDIAKLVREYFLQGKQPPPDAGPWLRSPP